VTASGIACKTAATVPSGTAASAAMKLAVPIISPMFRVITAGCSASFTKTPRPVAQAQAMKTGAPRRPEISTI
jgi:hypothetical protein